jgi:hypothetical protein
MNTKKSDQNSQISKDDIDLTDQDLGKVSGGASSDTFLTLDGIKGESKDDTHKDTIHIESFSVRKP